MAAASSSDVLAVDSFTSNTCTASATITRLVQSGLLFFAAIMQGMQNGVLSPQSTSTVIHASCEQGIARFFPTTTSRRRDIHLLELHHHCCWGNKLASQPPRVLLTVQDYTCSKHACQLPLSMGGRDTAQAVNCAHQGQAWPRESMIHRDCLHNTRLIGQEADWVILQHQQPCHIIACAMQAQQRFLGIWGQKPQPCRLSMKYA